MRKGITITLGIFILEIIKFATYRKRGNKILNTLLFSAQSFLIKSKAYYEARIPIPCTWKENA